MIVLRPGTLIQCFMVKKRLSSRRAFKNPHSFEESAPEGILVHPQLHPYKLYPNGAEVAPEFPRHFLGRVAKVGANVAYLS
jgi:hypothetical protein